MTDTVLDAGETPNDTPLDEAGLNGSAETEVPIAGVATGGDGVEARDAAGTEAAT